LGLLLSWRFPIGAFVDGIVLAALDGVEEDLGGFLDAFEKGIVVDSASSGFFVGMVLEDLFPVGALDLLLSGFVSIL
jgi:hypothetical protein